MQVLHQKTEALHREAAGKVRQQLADKHALAAQQTAAQSQGTLWTTQRYTRSSYKSPCAAKAQERQVKALKDSLQEARRRADNERRQRVFWYKSAQAAEAAAEEVRAACVCQRQDFSSLSQASRAHEEALQGLEELQLRCKGLELELQRRGGSTATGCLLLPAATSHSVTRWLPPCVFVRYPCTPTLQGQSVGSAQAPRSPPPACRTPAGC